MRNAIAVALILAMLVTGTLIALDLAALTATRSSVALVEGALPAGADRQNLIRSFYDAANAMLAGENAPLLAAVVSPHLEIHPDFDDTGNGTDGLPRYLEALRQRGEVSLHLVRLVGSGDEVAAVVEARGPAPAGEERGALLWRATDLFRIEAGMIVGYWPGTIAASATVPPEATIRASLRDGGASLTRLELDPDTAEMTLAAPYPHLFLVESGTLAVSGDAALSLARAGDAEFTAVTPDSGAGDLVLRPGDALLVAEQSTARLWNAGEASASALSLLIAPQSQLYSPVHALPSDFVTIVGIHDPWRIGRPITWDSGAVTETLAVSLFPYVDVDPEAIVVGSSPLALDPGQRLPPLPPGGLRLAIVRAGIVSVAGLDDLPTAAPVPGMTPHTKPQRSHTYRAGNAFAIEAGEAPTIENTGSTRADILLIALNALPSRQDGETASGSGQKRSE